MPLPADAAVDGAVADSAVAVDDESDEPITEPEDELACHELIRHSEAFAPELADDAPEYTWNIAVREHVLDEDCEQLWTLENRQCIATNGPAACPLPADITARLTTLGELGEKIAAARKRPATIGCKQAVAAHYADDRWRGRLDGFSAKVRTQVIADSRTLMQRVCKRDEWPERVRACLVLGGADLCFFDSPVARVWGFPAPGSVRTLGIPECDEYAAAVRRLAACTKVDAPMRESLVRTTDIFNAEIAAMPAAERAKRAPSCRAGLKPISDMIATFGC